MGAELFVAGGQTWGKFSDAPKTWTQRINKIVFLIECRGISEGYGLSGERGRIVSYIRPEFTSHRTTCIVFKCCKWGGSHGWDGPIGDLRSSGPWAALVRRDTSSKAAEAWSWLHTLHVISNVWTFSWSRYAVPQGNYFFVVYDRSWLLSAPCLWSCQRGMQSGLASASGAA